MIRFLPIVALPIAMLCAAATAATLPDAVTEALDQAGEARVVVLLELPGLATHSQRNMRRDTIRAAADGILADYGTEVILHHRFELVEALAMTVDRHTAERLARDPRIAALDLDAPGTGDLDLAVPLLNMDVLHALTTPPGGIQGQGAKVAVVDSGIESTHDDFNNALLDEACFCSGGSGCCPAGGPTQFGVGAAADDHGHGTWVSGFALSQGQVAPVGAAPQAGLVSAKVLDSNNSFCCASDVTAALDWLAVNHPDVDVVNASLSSNDRFPGACDSSTAWTTAMASAVAALAANNTLVVASSGNEADANHIGAPPCLSGVMAVGATYKRAYTGTLNFSSCSEQDPPVDQLTCYTNSSPELEIVAPGSVMVTSALGNATTGEAVSGTSFASPLVAGCAAQLRGAFPGVAHSDLREALKQTAVTVHDPRNGRTYPRLDCHSALLNLDWLFTDRFEP